jgi:signal transduction histidine kinase/AmiR/NasT family two-component response regulator
MSEQSPSILIVEDEIIVAMDLKHSLTDMGYDVLAIADSAEQAVEQASRICPDIVLMDIRIKGPNDGIQTAEILQKRFPLTVIYLTAHSDEPMIDRAKRTEPLGYLLKPVNVAQLHTTIEIAMYRRRVEQTREKLRATERRLNTIADHVPVSIVYYDREGRVQFANQVFRDLVPHQTDYTGKSAKSVLGDAMHKQTYPPRQRALAGEKLCFVVDLVQGGLNRKHEITYVPDIDSNGEVHGVYGLGYDVTAREKLTADLRQARTDLEMILNNVPASITSWHVDLTNRFANRAAELEFRIPSGQATGMQMRRILGDERFRRATPCITTALAGAASSQDDIERRTDGSMRAEHVHYVPESRGGSVVGLYALSVDITELSESHERIRDLAQRLETVREEERRAVAAILHDGIAQDLFAIKLGLTHLEAQVKRQRGVTPICQELAAAISKCMEESRQLANDLRPAALASQDMATVLRSHARYFGERSNLAITVTETKVLPDLGDELRLLLFRAAQEALTNVARHAHARHVEIVLSTDANRITMQIADDGVGIDPEATKKPRSLGILGIRERFAALGGGLTIGRREPHGTLMTVFLPRPVA